ncbi:ribonuclease HII [Peptococcaceae bacterium CEB3]|nr:ribonuclease HII [Peptococcaceae bacterium CEB3]
MRSAAQEAEEARIKGLLQVEEGLWQQGFLLVAGLDEAGRGPLAGPVFAAACILPARFRLPGLNDSKLLSVKKREALFPLIQAQALAWAVAEASVEEIDSLNILQATKLAMVRAVDALRVKPHYLLIDALELPLALPQRGLIGGDRLSASIAAASILAKVERDKLMERLDALYPGYGFARHKGYGTREHLQALQELGPCPAHRRSFAPVRTWASGKTEFI